MINTISAPLDWLWLNIARAASLLSSNDLACIAFFALIMTACSALPVTVTRRWAQGLFEDTLRVETTFIAVPGQWPLSLPTSLANRPWVRLVDLWQQAWARIAVRLVRDTVVFATALIVLLSRLTRLTVEQQSIFVNTMVPIYLVIVACVFAARLVQRAGDIEDITSDQLIRFAVQCAKWVAILIGLVALASTTHPAVVGAGAVTLLFSFAALLLPSIAHAAARFLNAGVLAISAWIVPEVTYTKSLNILEMRTWRSRLALSFRIWPQAFVKLDRMRAARINATMPRWVEASALAERVARFADTGWQCTPMIHQEQASKISTDQPEYPPLLREEQPTAFAVVCDRIPNDALADLMAFCQLALAYNREPSRIWDMEPSLMENRKKQWLKCERRDERDAVDWLLAISRDHSQLTRRSDPLAGDEFVSVRPISRRVLLSLQQLAGLVRFRTESHLDQGAVEILETAIWRNMCDLSCNWALVRVINGLSKFGGIRDIQQAEELELLVKRLHEVASRGWASRFVASVLGVKIPQHVLPVLRQVVFDGSCLPPEPVELLRRAVEQPLGVPLWDCVIEQDREGKTKLVKSYISYDGKVY